MYRTDREIQREQGMNNELGAIKISDEVIAVSAGKAAMETEGIYSLAGGFTDAFSENILRKSTDARGIRISRDEDEILIDLYLIVRYGISIPSVAWDVQEKVKQVVETLTGLQVSAVNIHVQGIHFEAD